MTSSLPTLTPSLLSDRPQLAVKVLQFGTGALLRGLPDYIIHHANQRGDFEGGIAVVASTGSGRTGLLQAQHGLFTHRVEGLLDGNTIEEFALNASIQAAHSAKDDWKVVLTYARQTEVEWIISNTTEAGIQYVSDDLKAFPPQSFPAKLTAFLYERWLHHPGHPPVILPTELLVDNGSKLREIVLRHASEHALEADFQRWIQAEVTFCNTLVDRIVTGRPAPEKFEALSRQVGYRDELLTVSEVYYLWAIEAPEQVRARLTFAHNDSGVVLTTDITPFRERKLRILNGSHTFMVGLAHLCGFQTVADCMADPDMGAFVRSLIHDEIVPSLPVGVENGDDFGKAVIDRYGNPYLHHQVLDITLQYTTKMAVRNALSLKRFWENQGRIPRLMSLGVAAFLLFARPVEEKEGKYYGSHQGKSYLLRDDKAAIWSQLWPEASPLTQAWVREALNQIEMSLSLEWEARVYQDLQALMTHNPLEVLRAVLAEVG